MFKESKALEIAALCVGLFCGGALLLVRVQSDATQALAARIGSRSVEAGAVSLSSSDKPVQAGLSHDAVLGRLEIRSIKLTVPILDGFDPSSLRKGVGHIQGTAMPGGLGNMALAGHRDTFFRPLQKIQQGMIMSVFTVDGRYDYVVDSTTIVDPEEVSVLAIHDAPEMTLITCYPFDYIGSAPHRFIVRAHLKSLQPST